MFPYPSGSLHLGHVRVYSSADVISRSQRMVKPQACVINPMGWDSFGLPAENAAISGKRSPKDWTYDNIGHMKHQLNSLGLQLDWREATSDPSFYKWTQWLLIQLYKKNLLYKSMAMVNWDPVDCTVLADDQIDEKGNSWRSGAPVQKRYLNQWFIKTSALVNCLYESSFLNVKDGINWGRILDIQRGWIGKPVGRIFYLKLPATSNILPVFSELPEKFFHKDAAIVIAPNHWLAENVASVGQITNPFTGKPITVRVAQTEEELESIPSNFKATVVSSSNRPEWDLQSEIRHVLARDPSLGGYLTSNRFTDWLISRQRYWGTPLPFVNCANCGIVPLDESHLPLELPPIKDMSVLLQNKSTSQEIKSKLAELAPDNWKHTNCPSCGSPGAIREMDTADTFVDSSWYYLRYASEPKSDEPFDSSFWNSKHNVNLYLGGPEHASGHMLTSRFMYHFLRKFGYIDQSSSKGEPYEKFLMQGIIRGTSYKFNGNYISKEQADLLVKSKKAKKKEIIVTNEKMSKSKGNGVNPDELVTKYGIDATRFTVLGYGSCQADRIWKGIEPEFVTTSKFIRKLILSVDQYIYLQKLLNESPSAPEVKRFNVKKSKDPLFVHEELQRLNSLRNDAIADVTIDLFISYKVGSASNAINYFLDKLRSNILTKQIGLSHEMERSIGDLLIMIYPIIPHLAHELWSGFVHYLPSDSISRSHYSVDKLVSEQAFPRVDDDYCRPLKIVVDAQEKFTLPLTKELFAGSHEEQLKQMALEFVSEKIPEVKLSEKNVQKITIFPSLRHRVDIRTGRPISKDKSKKNLGDLDDDED